MKIATSRTWLFFGKSDRFLPLNRYSEAYAELWKAKSLDNLDRKIIAALSENARMSLKELARIVGLASPTVTERVKRLEERGYITGYVAVLDQRKLGYPLQALVRINPLPGTLHEVERMIKDMPQFVECDRVTGEDCFVGRLYIRTIEELDSILDSFHEKARTNTSIVKGQPVTRRLPPLNVETVS